MANYQIILAEYKYEHIFDKIKYEHILDKILTFFTKKKCLNFDSVKGEKYPPKHWLGHFGGKLSNILPELLNGVIVCKDIWKKEQFSNPECYN